MDLGFKFWAVRLQNVCWDYKFLSYNSPCTWTYSLTVILSNLALNASCQVWVRFYALQNLIYSQVCVEKQSDMMVMGKKDVCGIALLVSKILESKSCLKFMILKCPLSKTQQQQQKKPQTNPV